MNNPVFKLDTNNSQVVLASDFHIFHKREFVWQARGFKSIWEHAEWIRNEFNELAKAGEVTVIYLGDGFLNSTPEEVKSYLHGFTQNITFLYFYGNHESSPYKLYKEELYKHYPDFQQTKQELYPLSVGNTIYCGNQAFIQVDKTPVFCSHFAHEIWDGMQHGIPHAFGHSHGSLKSGSREALGQKKLDVGVDNTLRWFNKPYILWNQFKSIMDSKSVTVLDHHGENVDSSFKNVSGKNE